MRKIIVAVLMLLLLIGCAAAPATDFPEEELSPELAGAYDIVRVVDGDTIIVDIDGEETRVRLIGIDTPESVNPNAAKNTEMGEIASAYTKELLSHKTVYLEYDIDKTDDYDRTLAYVYLSDGVTMVNALLMENGYASIMTIQPNSKYADTFYELQKEAQKEKIGIWSED